jgi:hypothetical protein
MKYCIGVSFLFLLAVNILLGKGLPKNFSGENFKGKVHVITQYNGKKGEKDTWTMIYRYDSLGNRVKSNVFRKNIFNANGIMGSTTTYEYDKNGNEIEHRTYNSDSELTWVIKHRYDTYGNKVKTFIYNFHKIPDGKLIGITSYIYKNTQLIREEKESDSTIYHYDNSGNIIETIEYDNGILRTRQKYRYDSLDNMIEVIYFQNNEGKEEPGVPKDWTSTSQYIYENYDSYGNWLKKTEYSNGKLFSTYEREITYH